jgi:Protein of unknown function (DUF2721)
MSVEQTTQLIQLVLNSVVMSVACALVLMGLTNRLNGIGDRIQTLHDQIAETGGSHGEMHADASWHHAIQLRKQLRRSQSRYKVNHFGVLAAYYALLFTVLSCFALALRGLLPWNGLISIALLLFMLGVAVLLVAIALTLFDLHLSDRSMREEMSKLFQGIGNRTAVSKLTPPKRTKSRSTSQPQPKPRPKVGMG